MLKNIFVIVAEFKDSEEATAQQLLDTGSNLNESTSDEREQKCQIPRE